MNKKKIALCGASSRGFRFYARSITDDKNIAEKNKLVGTYDINH